MPHDWAAGRNSLVPSLSDGTLTVLYSSPTICQSTVWDFPACFRYECPCFLIIIMFYLTIYFSLKCIRNNNSNKYIYINIIGTIVIHRRFLLAPATLLWAFQGQFVSENCVFWPLIPCNFGPSVLRQFADRTGRKPPFWPIWGAFSGSWSPNNERMPRPLWGEVGAFSRRGGPEMAGDITWRYHEDQGRWGGYGPGKEWCPLALRSPSAKGQKNPSPKENKNGFTTDSRIHRRGTENPWNPWTCRKEPS